MTYIHSSYELKRKYAMRILLNYFCGNTDSNVRFEIVIS